jgi:hypothetical protein
VADAVEKLPSAGATSISSNRTDIHNRLLLTSQFRCSDPRRVEARGARPRVDDELDRLPPARPPRRYVSAASTVIRLAKRSTQVRMFGSPGQVAALTAGPVDLSNHLASRSFPFLGRHPKRTHGSPFDCECQQHSQNRSAIFTAFARQRHNGCRSKGTSARPDPGERGPDDRHGTDGLLSCPHFPCRRRSSAHMPHPYGKRTDLEAD